MAADAARAREAEAGLPASVQRSALAEVPAALGVLAPAAVALWLTFRSLGWPLVHDAPLMHYVAARLLEGAVPYRDLFDMNFPGVYFVHMLGLTLFGREDAGFRALDLLLLASTVAGVAVMLRPFGRWAGASAVALFWLHHVAGGAWHAGQRDLILCVPLVWMGVATLAHLRSGRLLPLGLAGLNLGAAVWVKPYALLVLPLLAALVWRYPRGRRLRASAALAAGVAGPAVAVFAWLGATGGLTAFLDIVGGYLIPLYSTVGRVPLVATVVRYDLGMPVLAGLGLWASGGVAVLWRTGRADRCIAVLVTGLAYGGFHFVVQGKGWEYHLYPFALFAIALGAAGFGAALGSGRRLAAATLVAALLVTLGLGAKGLRNLDPAWIVAKRARAHAVAAVLRPLVADGGTVQVLDTTDGGVHALYLLGARQPTRFLYDFHFYHDLTHPYVRRLRAELLEGLRLRPPTAVVLFERGWPSGDYSRLAGFPALAAWLEAGYRVAREGEGYRVYVPERSFAPGRRASRQGVRDAA